MTPPSFAAPEVQDAVVAVVVVSGVAEPVADVVVVVESGVALVLDL